MMHNQRRADNAHTERTATHRQCCADNGARTSAEFVTVSTPARTTAHPLSRWDDACVEMRQGHVRQHRADDSILANPTTTTTTHLYSYAYHTRAEDSPSTTYAYDLPEDHPPRWRHSPDAYTHARSPLLSVHHMVFFLDNQDKAIIEADVL
jgi:hypothetical protein